MTKLEIVALICAIGVFILVIDLLRRHRLRERYAAAWFFLSLAVLIIAIWGRLARIIADALGFIATSNLIFFLSIIVLAGVCVQLSCAIGDLEERARTNTEALGLIDERVRRLEDHEKTLSPERPVQ